MNKLFLIVFLALSFSAVLINLQFFNKPFPSDFEQGAYNILLKAEEDVIQNKIEEAIEKFKVAMMRSHRCGRKGVYARIRVRLATIGFEEGEKEPEKASKFLCAYALFAKDFEKTATQIESFILNKSRGKVISFAYPLVYKNGTRTFWLESPKVSPIFLYRKFEPETELYKYPGNLTYLKSKDLPENRKFSYFYPISIGCPKGTRDFILSVNSFEEKEFDLAVGTNNSNTFYHNTKTPHKIKPGNNNFIKIDSSKWYFVLNSAIVFSNNLEFKKMKIDLVRDYKPL